MSDFRTFLEETTGVDADTVLNIFDKLDKAFPSLQFHQDIRERWDETYADDSDRSDYQYEQQMDRELQQHWREAAREMNRIRESGL